MIDKGAELGVFSDSLLELLTERDRLVARVARQCDTDGLTRSVGVRVEQVGDGGAPMLRQSVDVRVGLPPPVVLDPSGGPVDSRVWFTVRPGDSQRLALAGDGGDA